MLTWPLGNLQAGAHVSKSITRVKASEMKESHADRMNERKMSFTDPNVSEALSQTPLGIGSTGEQEIA
jgi:hypothetical protein